MRIFSVPKRTLIACRMVGLAEEYLDDGKILSEKMSSSGSGATLLTLLGLEIHLKAAVMFRTGERPANHKFYEIWKKLPEEVQEEVLNEAKDRYPTHTDFNNFEAILTAFSDAFVAGRYSYEKNDDRTSAEATEAGERWIEDGGAMKEAELAYYPMERSALIYALRNYWRRQETVDFDVAGTGIL
ncbi:MAG: hypothetical protein ABJL72_18420 [Roseobacter sp.]